MRGERIASTHRHAQQFEHIYAGQHWLQRGDDGLRAGCVRRAKARAEGCVVVGHAKVGEPRDAHAPLAAHFERHQKASVPGLRGTHG